jgi:hypothetical protein
MNTIQVQQEIPLEKVAGLLCSGFEGGVGYWCQIVDYVSPEIPRSWPVTQKYPNKSVLGGDQIYKHVDYPLLKGGSVKCVAEVEEDSPTYTLDFEAVTRGLRLMAEKHPNHYSDFVSERYDSETGDVFIQLCLLGDVLYG